jgi:hypothetical protein
MYQGWYTPRAFYTDRQTWLSFYNIDANVDAEYPNISRLVYPKSVLHRQTDMVEVLEH